MSYCAILSDDDQLVDFALPLNSKYPWRRRGKRGYEPGSKPRGPQPKRSYNAYMARSEILQESVGIIGAGNAGLIHNPRTTSRWIRRRNSYFEGQIYWWNLGASSRLSRSSYYNVHEEYRYSALEIPSPENAPGGGDCLTGFGMCDYMEKFTEKFLTGKAKFQMETEVLNIERDNENGNWNISVQD